FSGGYKQSDRFSYYYDPNRVDVRYPVEDPSRGLQTGNINGALEYRINREVSAYAEGGVNYGRFDTIGATAILDLIGTSPQTYVMAGLTSGWGGIRAFWNHFAADADLAGTQAYPLTLENDTIDVEGELAREFDLVVHHNLHVGAGYRYKGIDWNLMPERRTEHHYSAFFQDTMRLADAVSLVAGFRVDRHPLLEQLQFSPRGALVFRPTEESAIRVSSGRAFRTQTFLESYLQTPFATTIPAINALGLGSYYRERLFGAEPLAPEQNVSSEIGYSMSTDTFTFDVAGYVNRVRDLIIQVPEVSPVTLSDVINNPSLGFDPSISAYTYGSSGHTNDPTVFTVYGGEASLRVFPVRGLDLYANYALNKTHVSENSERESERRTSLH
ncbi:MAG: TonB-dependent receptor, partial [Polyangiaceae bacterium]|nr:TonB-dependent receptor [Polyangiaceae bacterium]